ncbi:RNA-binding domain-containing protein [Sinanaerobacter sp. ZZT-01]|uniref:RNA-binding domain-containing protein n=1 Tax=Sinanaerobacter sp. ZZT-01 TaxID=3111540 RepID=UPI002D7831D1|nr:RNA-binding domain-containing protein [Sinanaerobacter sp. ZZT-01]WRR95105.1 RNA-binding domain-containing protein [Sinanaerobacter sp. ZZT-01]
MEKKSEGDYWDYKQEWHSDNGKLLHDILCFANTVHNEDCYIIIGVTDNGEIIGLSEDSPNRKNQENILTLLHSTVFAGDLTPSISLETIKINDKEVDVLTIHNSFDVPYYLKFVSKRSNGLQFGYIYSRNGDRNTPITENSPMGQIELLWKKRLGLLNPPLQQIVSRLKNKTEWEKIEDTYYNIYNPDFKLVEEWDDEDRRHDNRPFYSYNQCNESTSFTTLKIMCRETVLKQFEIVTLDSGRYSTPAPEWGFIHDPIHKTQSLFSYRYMLKGSIDFALQQFLYDEENQEEWMARYRFDEVVLYFDNKTDQENFHQTIECNPEIVNQYIEDAKLRSYPISSNNKLEIKDVTNKLITGFAFNRFLFDYRRRQQGVEVKRIKSVKVISSSATILGRENVAKEQIDINENGAVRHSLFNNSDKKPEQVFKYKVDKYWMREFLNFLEPITTEWKTDYTVKVCSEYNWEFIMKYSDGTIKKVKGTFAPSPEGEEVERRIQVLTKYDIKPIIF